MFLCPRQRRGSASARILKGFLKSKNNFCPLKRKFEPIFFRKSRILSGFSCKAIISACFTAFMNLAASSNRLLLFCSKAFSLSFKSCFLFTTFFFFPSFRQSLCFFFLFFEKKREMIGLSRFSLFQAHSTSYQPNHRAKKLF